MLGARPVRERRAAVCLSGAVLLLAMTVIATSQGPANISYASAAAILLKPLGMHLDVPFTLTEERIIEFIRLPRIAAAVLVGMALAVAGTVTQGVFRNPLADPGLIGISSGAAVGAVATIALGLPQLHPLILPAGAFAGAVSATALVVGLGGRRSAAGVGGLLLAGVAVSSFLGAITAVVLTSTEERDVLREMLFWLVGGLDNRDWTHVGLVVGPIVLGSTLTYAFARDLNLLTLGDEGARALGVRTRETRVILLSLAALIASVAVSISGTIAFVGLVIPHVMRALVGPDHRILLPAAALGGALFLLVADTLARLVLQPVELRVGIVTALVGGPFFLFVLETNRRRHVP